MRAKSHRAFTLVELMVVIAIIGLLVSVLMPSVSAARSSARGAVCMSNLRQLGVAMQDYVVQNRAYPPFRLKQVDDVGTYVNQYGRAKPRWQWFLLGHVQPVIDPNGFERPFGDNDTAVDGRSGRMMTNPYFLDPAFDGDFGRDIRNGPYGYNYQYLGNSRQNDKGEYVNWPVGDSRIAVPFNTVLFADSRGADRHHGKHSYTLDPPKKALDTRGEPMAFGPKSPGDGPIPHSPVEMRHRGKGNAVFIDTHVEAKTLRELGYEVDPTGVAIPVDPLEKRGTRASNRLWTGLGQDQLMP